MQNDAKNLKMTETLAPGYSSEITQRELSNEYQYDIVLMFFKDLCILVLWTKVGSAVGGLNYPIVLANEERSPVIVPNSCLVRSPVTGVNQRCLCRTHNAITSTCFKFKSLHIMHAIKFDNAYLRYER